MFRPPDNAKVELILAAPLADVNILAEVGNGSDSMQIIKNRNLYSGYTILNRVHTLRTCLSKSPE